MSATQKMPAARPARGATLAAIPRATSPLATKPAATPAQTRARRAPIPRNRPPASASHAGRKAGAGEGHAGCDTQVTSALSGNPSLGNEGAGEGQECGDTQDRTALSGHVSEIVRLQRVRKFCIVSQSRCDRSIESFLASLMGYRIDGDGKDRKAVFARAKAFRLACEKGEGQRARDTQRGAALSHFIPMVLASAQARAVWDQQRDNAEREMQRLAKLLPIWPFVEQVRGLGAKGLAIIVGEAGIPLGDYRTLSGLWKRMGLAVIAGERQQRKKEKEAAAEHGYSPGRRSQVWAVCSDSLFRAQWRGADEDAGTEAHPIGPYGEVYARRRAHTAPRIEATADLPAADPAKWTKGRAHNDARRIMTKRLLADLWEQWRLSEEGTVH